LAAKLRAGCHEQDDRDGYCKEEIDRVSSHTSGLDDFWKVIGPPHKFRYCVLDHRSDQEVPSLYQAEASHITILRTLQDELFSSDAFRAWLAAVSRLCPRRYSVKARRFRPGLDYTLASGNDYEARLDVVLDLTPSDVLCEKEGHCGGWECYMAPDDGHDPAVYRSGSSGKKPANGLGPQTEIGTDTSEPRNLTDEEEDLEDGALLTKTPSFNQLLIVLRDEGVLHFVKYVSVQAQGSRWDVSGEYEIDRIELDDEDDDPGAGGLDDTTDELIRADKIVDSQN